MTPLRIFYLATCIAAIVVTIAVDPIWRGGALLWLFDWNLFFVWLAFAVFAFNEAVARKDHLPLMALPLGAVFGLGAALSLYLFLRSRDLN